MNSKLRQELEAMKNLQTGDSFTAEHVHILVDGILEGGGEFKYVNYDSTSFPYPQTIGSTANSIVGLGNADESMIDTIFIMPNKGTDSTATLMIVVDEVTPSTDPKTYQYVYVGNINDLPSDVLTESSIINDLTSGGTNKPLSAEQGRTLNSHVNYTICGSGAADQVKLISNDGFELSTHLRLLVMMTNTNTNSTPKFNINNTGVKDVWYNGAVASDTNTWGAGEVLDVYYDGNKYIANTHGGAQFSTGEKVGDVGIDSEPTAGSDNLVKSKGSLNKNFVVSEMISSLIRDNEFHFNKDTFGVENGYYGTTQDYSDLVFWPNSIHRSIVFETKGLSLKGIKLLNSYPNPAVANILYFYDNYWHAVTISLNSVYTFPTEVEKLCVNLFSLVGDYPNAEVVLYSDSTLEEQWFPRDKQLCLNNDKLVNNNMIYPEIGYLFPNQGYLNPSGVYYPADSWRSTEYIPVIKGDIIKYRICSQANVVASIALYNINKEFISQGSIIPTQDGIIESTLTIPEGVYYLRSTTAYSGSSIPEDYKLGDCYLLINSQLSFKERFNKLETGINNIIKTYLNTEKVKASQVADVSFKEDSTVELQDSGLTDQYYAQAGTSIVVNSMSGLGSLFAINVEEGKRYYLKIMQSVTPSLFNAYFIFATNTTTAAISQSDISKYVKSIDSQNYIWEITIPTGCNFVITAGYANTFDSFWIKELDSKILDWIRISTSNLTDELNESIQAAIEAGESITDIQTKQNKLIETIHLFDSIKKPITFSGKRLTAFGDSITWGVCSPNLQPAGVNKYISLFCSWVGATELNYAKSGACIVPDQNEIESIYTTITSYQGTTDIIVIAGGVNDWQTQSPIGNFSDTGTTTLYGCLNGICSYLKTNYPDANVIFITPIPTTSTTTFGTTHPDNLNLYRKAIQEVAAVNGFNVVNGADLGLPDEMTPYGNAMFDDSDRVHPTIAGHALYARSLTGKLL